MKVTLKMANTLENQGLSRQIRDHNQKNKNEITISFSEDLNEIIMEGQMILVPHKKMLDGNVQHSGELRQIENLYRILPIDRGKTVNLHLDSHLAKELEEIRKHVSSKTQHDILLEIFKKGIKQYKHDQD